MADRLNDFQDDLETEFKKIELEESRRYKENDLYWLKY